MGLATASASFGPIAFTFSGAFYTQLEAMQDTFNENVDLLALLPIPYANLVGFFSQEYQDSRVRIWRSDEAKSRFRLTSDFSFKEALSPTHPPFDNVDVQTPSDGSETSGNLEVIEARPNSLKIAPTTDVPQLLVTTDCYDPGWSVRIDGKGASLLRANGSFMGTIISSASRHAIEFRYLPRSFVQGVLISSICILAMAGLLLPQMRLSLSNLEMIETLTDFRLGNYNGVFLVLFLVAIRRYCVSLRSFWLLLHPLMRRNC